MNNFPQKLKLEAQRLNVSHEELGNLIGYSRATISLWARGCHLPHNCTQRGVLAELGDIKAQETLPISTEISLDV